MISPVEVGAPPLPEPFFYRVTHREDPFGHSRLTVAICTPRKHRSPKEIASVGTYFPEVGRYDPTLKETAREAVKRLATLAFQAVEADVVFYKALEDLKPYLGDADGPACRATKGSA